MLNLLLVEDSPSDARLMQRVLEDGLPVECNIAHVETLAEARAILRDRAFDVVLLDIGLPDGSGLDILHTLREDGVDLPVIVVTGVRDDATALKASVRGAVDFVPKSEASPVLLSRVVRYAVSQRQARRRLHDVAVHDAVTGLMNRDGFCQRLAGRLAQDRASLGALLLLDINRFSVVNRALGSEVGDAVLDAVGRLAAEAAEGRGFAGRTGADEFALFLEGIGRSEATAIAHALTARFSGGPILDDRAVHLSASVGVAHAPTDGGSADLLLSAADAAMRKAKVRGANAVEVSTGPTDRADRSRLASERDVRQAVADERLVVQYQPRIDLTTGRIAAVEALVRIDLPGQGLVLPAAFLPVAEDCGLTVTIGQQVLERACRDTARWQESGQRHLRLSANLSPRQVLDPGLVASVRAALEGAGLPAADLELEISESFSQAPSPASLGVLMQLCALGVQLSLDDFGTGITPVSWLRGLPFAAVKLDRSVIQELEASERERTIFSGLVGIVHDIGGIVVAEGIETERHLALCRRIGCDQGQGFLFTEPLDAEAITRWMQQHQPSRWVA